MLNCGLTIIIFSLLKVLVLPVAFSDDGSNNFDESIRNYKQDRWSAAEGLPVTTLLEIAQTKDGYLWISSFDGLVKFNGLKFELFSRKILEVVNNNVCKSVALDSQGKLWVGTHGSGLFYYYNGEFHSHASDQGFIHHINKLYHDSRGILWVGTIGHGLFKVTEDAIVPVHDKGWLADKSISSITESSDGRLWIGTEGSGIVSLAGDQEKRYRQAEGLASDLVFALHYDSGNRLWIGTDKGVSWMDANGVHRVEETRGMVCRAIVENKQGLLWFGFDGGISRYNPWDRTIETLDEKSGFGHLATKDILIDREENIWIATKFGELIRLRSSNFTHISSVFGIRGKTIYSVFPLASGEIMVGSNEGYLDTIGNEGIKPYHLDSQLLGKRIRHVMQDSKGRIWYSTYSGLLREEKDGSLKWFNLENGFPENRVRISFEDSSGHVWVGTRGKGLFRFDENDNYININPQGKLESSLIMSLKEDARGNLWVGTSGSGLVVIKNDRLVKHYNYKNGFISDIVFNTYIDKEDIVWVAANGGIARIENGHFTCYNTDQGLLSESPYDIVEDKRGNFWIPCNLGIMRLEKSQLIASPDESYRISSCRLFDHYDGIKAPFTATSKAYIDTEGGLWLPTYNGIVLCNTGKFVENNYRPISHITSVTVDSDVKDHRETIELKPGEKRIRFIYNALSLVAPKSVKYKTMLEGYEDEWSEVSKESSVSFTNLAPGNYRFRIIACNNDGIWSNNDASVSFLVTPHLFQQEWFLLLLGGLLVIAIIGFVHLRTKRIRVSEKKLQRLVKERTVEIDRKNELLEDQASELKGKNTELEIQQDSLKLMNKELESFNHVVSHDLRAPLNVIRGYSHLIMDSEEEELDPVNLEFLQKIGRQTERMNNMISDLLDMSIASRQEIKMDMVNLSLQAKDVFASLGRTEPERDAGFICEGGLQAECDETLIRIVLENLIGNAWKYTGKENETRIEFGLCSENEENIYFVKDNGAGFDMSKRGELFVAFKRLHHQRDFEGIGIGLNSVKRIIGRHGGRIWAEAEPEKGATFFFTLK